MWIEAGCVVLWCSLRFQPCGRDGSSCHKQLRPVKHHSSETARLRITMPQQAWRVWS